MAATLFSFLPMQILTGLQRAQLCVLSSLRFPNLKLLLSLSLSGLFQASTASFFWDIFCCFIAQGASTIKPMCLIFSVSVIQRAVQGFNVSFDAVVVFRLCPRPTCSLPAVPAVTPGSYLPSPFWVSQVQRAADGHGRWGRMLRPWLCSTCAHVRPRYV